MTLTWRATPC